MRPRGSAPTEVMSPGARVGRYEVIARLATGGMAEIFLARAVGLEGWRKLVVLKRILPEFAKNAEFVRMFLDEARLAALLEHPNIAQVYDLGACAGGYYFAMEYVHGESLLRLVTAARYGGRDVPIDQAVTIGAAVAAGLHHAHQKVGPDGVPLAIVHRDVSPSNILVSYEGAVKVVDFGVARAAERLTHTRVGTLKGKVAYMSPEQCRGEELDGRSDVYSIGVLLYEMTTGTRPFWAESELLLLNRIAGEDVPPPSTRCSGYHPRLERVILRALARDREERYQSALELQVELEELARAERMSLSPVSLARYLERIFGRPSDPWREARRAETLAHAGTALTLGVGDAARGRRSRRFATRVAIAAAAILVLLAALGLGGGGGRAEDGPAPRPPPPAAPVVVYVPSGTAPPVVVMDQPLPSPGPVTLPAARASAKADEPAPSRRPRAAPRRKQGHF